MKDKEIEKMARIIKAVKYEPFNYGKPTYTVGNQMADFVFDLIAEELLKHYQPKVPVNSVALSMEEYNALLLEQTRLKEIVDRIPCGYALKEDTRKETAGKIFQRLFEEHSAFSNNDIIVIWQVKEVLRDIAKQFGVEVEE